MNKSQTSGHNGLSPPLFLPEVCNLFADAILKPHPLLLHQHVLPQCELYFQSLKNEVVKQKSNTYRNDRMEKCDLGIINCHD